MVISGMMDARSVRKKKNITNKYEEESKTKNAEGQENK
jgi:hypothetical protein